MYKGRVGIWITVILCCTLISGLFKWVPTWFESNDLTVNIEIKQDDGLSEVLSRNKINGYRLNLKDKDSDIIISDGMDKVSGYTKIEDKLFSPLVMYIRADIDDHPEGLIKMGTNSYAFKIDLYTVLDAMEKGKEWEDLGFSNKIIKGPVTIYIPNEQASYYNQVVELFYLTLNNGEIPDGETKEVLKPRVDNLIAKCVKVVDINQAVYEEYKKSSTNHKVFIGPEYLYRRGAEYSMSRNYEDSFQPVYFMKTVTLYADIFVKEAEDGNNLDKFIEKITEKDKFMSCTGWRVEDSTFDISHINSAYIKEPN